MRVGIPIDISARELNGKLWLASNLVEQGHEVVIGDISLHKSVDIFKPDVLFAHGATDYADQITKTGCKLVYMDTEGGVFHSKEAYRERIAPLVDYVDTFFVWGEIQSGIAEEAGYSNVKITGNPRFDLLQPGLRGIYRNKALEIEREFGPFFLINTNFVSANSPSDYHRSIPSAPPIINSSSAWTKLKLIHFIKMTKRLSQAFPNQSIILRPHPSENHDTYHRFFSDIDNIYVRYEDNVRAWIHAAEAVVHCGCTTGIESVLMNTPTYAYVPQKSEYSDNLPNTVSEVVEDLSTLTQLLDSLDFSTNYSLTKPQKSHLKQYFYNIECLAAPDIAKSVSVVDGGYSGGFSPARGNRFRRGANICLGHKNIDRIRRLGIKDGWKYSQQKFPYISEDSIKERIDFLVQFCDDVDIKCKRIRRIENTFLIKAQN